MRNTTVRLLEAAVAGEPKIHKWKIALIEALLAANRFEEAVTLAESLQGGSCSRSSGVLAGSLSVKPGS